MLILDGHVSHSKNVEAIIFSREHGIVMLSLPPHTTHRLQPLDRSFYKPLMVHYNKACDVWIRPERRNVTIYQISRLLGDSYARSATMRTAQNGFQCTGIWPCNRDVFDDTDFIASERFCCGNDEEGGIMPSTSSTHDTSGVSPSPSTRPVSAAPPGSAVPSPRPLSATPPGSAVPSTPPMSAAPPGSAVSSTPPVSAAPPGSAVPSTPPVSTAPLGSAVPSPRPVSAAPPGSVVPSIHDPCQLHNRTHPPHLRTRLSSSKRTQTVDVSSEHL